MAVKKLNLAVFISGRGSNLQSLIDACSDPEFPANISLVLSNRPEVLGLQKAENASIPAITVDHKNYESKALFENALQAELEKHPVDIICLAGFMRILSAEFVARWGGKIINIHPSLLPDYKGLNTYERALADGQDKSGCTVHFVTPEIDDGEIIIQKEVRILPDDTPDILAKRILVQEHIAYPEAIRVIAKSKGSGEL